MTYTRMFRAVNTLSIKAFYVALASVVLSSFVVRIAYATTGATSFANPLAVNDLWGFLLLILNAVTYIMFPIIVLMIVYTGFLFVSAQGNAAKIQEARRALLWTVVGALVILGSRALALVIEATVAELTI